MKVMLKVDSKFYLPLQTYNYTINQKIFAFKTFLRFIINNETFR